MSNRLVVSWDALLNTVLFAGRIMLENGGEIGRVEETAGYLLQAYGVNDYDCYATPTVWMVSFRDDEGTNYAAMRRIDARSSHLSRVAEVNQLSRQVCEAAGTMDLHEVYGRLEKCEKKAAYPDVLKVLGAALAAGFFTLMINSRWLDAVTAFAAGGLVKCITLYIAKRQANTLVVNLAGGLLTSLLVCAAARLGWAINAEATLVSALMPYLPGLLVVTTARDFARGDLVSGISNGFEALFVMLVLAVGAAMPPLLLAGCGL